MHKTNIINDIDNFEKRRLSYTLIGLFALVMTGLSMVGLIVSLEVHSKPVFWDSLLNTGFSLLVWLVVTSKKTKLDLERAKRY